MKGDEDSAFVDGTVGLYIVWIIYDPFHNELNKCLVFFHI